MPQAAHNLVWCIVHNSIIIIIIIVIYISITKCEWYSGVSYFDANMKPSSKGRWSSRNKAAYFLTRERALSPEDCNNCVIYQLVNITLYGDSTLLWARTLLNSISSFCVSSLNSNSNLSSPSSILPYSQQGRRRRTGNILYSLWLCELCSFDCCLFCDFGCLFDLLFWLLSVCFAKQNGCEITGHVRLDWRKASQPWVELYNAMYNMIM